MSAAIVILHRDAAHMLTDGASWDSDFTMRPVCKAWPLPHLNAVLAATGPLLQAPLLFSAISQSAATFDELRNRFETTMQDMADSLMRFAATQANARFTVVVAGLSESRGPAGFLWRFDDQPNPCRTQDLGRLALIPGDQSTHAALHETFPGLTDADTLDPVADGVTIMDLQRRNRAWGIGGHVQLTTVRREGIFTRIVHRWAETSSPEGVRDAA